MYNMSRQRNDNIIITDNTILLKPKINRNNIRSNRKILTIIIL